MLLLLALVQRTQIVPASSQMQQMVDLLCGQCTLQHFQCEVVPRHSRNVANVLQTNPVLRMTSTPRSHVRVANHTQRGVSRAHVHDDVSDRVCCSVVRALVVPVLDGDRKTRLDVEEVPVPTPRASSTQHSDLSLGKAVRDLLRTHDNKLRSSPISRPPHSAVEPLVDEQSTGHPRLARHSRPRTPDKNSSRRAQTHASCRPQQHTDQNESGLLQKALWTGSVGYRTRALPHSARRSTRDIRRQKNPGRCSTGRLANTTKATFI